MSKIGCHFPLSYLIKFLTKSHHRPMIWLRFCHLPDVQGNPCFHPQTFRQQTLMVCFPDMRWCQITPKALPPLFLIILALTPPVVEGLDLFGRVDDDLSAAGRFLSNEVINGNSSLLLGLQTTLDGLYDYIGDRTHDQTLCLEMIIIIFSSS